MWQYLINIIVSSLEFFYDITVTIGIPSYALAILLLTVVIKLLLYPLSYKQMYSMKKMQEIQPQVKEIQDKYKKNPEKANQAVIEIYKKNKVNPMAGCLPLIVQMPILLALFRALQAFEYKELGSSFLWVPSLTNPDPYMVIPIIVAIATYFQSKLTSTGNDSNPKAAQTQKMMLYFMPLMIGWMSMRFPAGLGLYWIYFSILGTVQQLYINRKPEIK